MERFKLTLLIIVMCLLGSKAQAMTVNYEESTKTLTITLDKGEYLYQQVEKNDNLKDYYASADKVIIKTNTTEVETISNLTYLVPNDFTVLNKFTQVTTMDLHSVNYLFSDISFTSSALKYVRLRDGIKNIQKSWFSGAKNFEGAYSYCGKDEDNKNAYCVYFNSQSQGNLGNTCDSLKNNFTEITNNDEKFNPDQAHLYVLVNGKINSNDLSLIGGSNFNYSAIDLSLLNASYVGNDGNTDYKNFKLKNINGRLKSVALPSDMDSIANECLSGCTSLTKIIIPDGVKSIGVEAFRDCNHITSINIPEGCKTIGKSAFLNTRLQAVKLPSTLTDIGDEAFTGNKDLTSITFPKPADGVTLSLGNSVFSGCNNLRDIYITSTAPTIVNKTESIEGTFTNTQLGQNPNGQNLTDDDSVTIDNYRTNGQDNPIFLHYPVGKGSEYGETTGSSRAQTYSLTGADGNKYPKNNTEANEWYEHHSGWAQFVFAAPNTETPIPVPEQYNADRWYTMCFPFNLTRKQIEDTFGSGTEVCDFQYVEKEQIGEVTVYSIRFNKDLIVNGLKDDGETPITPGSKIITKANLPYMIHPSQKPNNGKYQITDGDRWEYKEENEKTVKTGQLISFDVTNKKPGSTKGDISDATASSAAHVDAVFQGNYEENKLIPYGVFFLGGNEYYKIEASNDPNRETGHLRQFTAYVQITDEEFNADKYIANLRHYSQPNQAKIIYPSQWGEDDMSSSTTTAILPVHVASKPIAMENVRIYNLQGQLVGIGADSLKTLHNGIYVMNGKKYVIR